MRVSSEQFSSDQTACFCQCVHKLRCKFRAVLDLLQRLRTRENEQRRQQQRSRGGSRDGRKSLSYDAAPFNIQNVPSSSSQEQSSSSSSTAPIDVAAQTSGSATSSGSVSGTDLSIQRRQLGERLYPKVHVIQPVCIMLGF